MDLNLSWFLATFVIVFFLTSKPVAVVFLPSLVFGDIQLPKTLAAMLVDIGGVTVDACVHYTILILLPPFKEEKNSSRALFLSLFTLEFLFSLGVHLCP